MNPRTPGADGPRMYPVLGVSDRLPVAGRATPAGQGWLRRVGPLGVACLLSGCAATLPTPPVGPEPAARWQAPSPTATPAAAPVADPAERLRTWWQQWQDPVLLDLLARAQQASPSVAAAATRVAQARQAVVASGAAGRPGVSASAGVGRAVSFVNTPPLTQASLGLQASWELDLFGGVRAGAQAADQRLQAARAQWHEARVAVAAELASQYAGWRSCRQVLAIVGADAQSRTVLASLSEARAQAGFDAPATAALATAGAAQARMAHTEQQARCDTALKGLVALTGLDEPELRTRLSAGADTPPAPLPELPGDALPVALPAQLLAQRPDVFAAQRAVVAASADVGAAEADRYPRLSLGGAITGYQSRGAAGDGSTWTLGPLQISVPLFDAGRRQGQVVALQAAYDETVVAYRATVRTALREVEQALVALHSTAQRQRDAAVATQGFAQALQATTERHRAGLASRLELEDTRRTALAAELALAQLSHERLQAWVDLYRALGGGWTAADVLASGLPPGEPAVARY